MLFLSIVFLALMCQWICLAYVDFGHLTEVKTMSTVPLPRPHQLPQQWEMPYKPPQYHMITVVKPFLTMCGNGTNEIQWQTTYNAYSRRFSNARGIFKRQDGVFESDASLLATCTPCATSSGDQTTLSTCYASTYTGVLNAPVFSYSGTVCYASGYAGALQSVSTSIGLPCCPSCIPDQNSTATITSGVLVPPSTSTGTATGRRSTHGPSMTPGTTTVIYNTSTLPPVTISKTTITPPTSASPTITSGPATIIGCGTASGSGTVDGSGTVYLGPYGIFPVTSSGVVSGFASTVIGCGTIIATSGRFNGTATITGCGTGTGCAALIGIGTVYPRALGGLVGISSSGTITGCGKVVGCGTLTGTGTFTITGLYTKTVTQSRVQSTVNIYVSYCPPEPPELFRMASNLTDPAPVGDPALYPNHTLPYYTPPFNSSALPGNATNSSSALNNPLCQVCSNDSGICCPLFAACGADGHCPHSALVGAGYILHGTNIVDMGNSSDALGMIDDPSSVAPGLPGSDQGTQAGDGSQDAVRRASKRYVQRHKHGHGNWRGYGRW